jgi:hypothetical protein
MTNVWSQIARLGAFVAVFGPPVATQAAEEPERVELPTLDTANQPEAVVAGATQPDVDPYAWLDAVVAGEITPSRYFATIPADLAVPHPAWARYGELRRHPDKDSPKGRGAAKPHAGGWYGGGQRYG